MEPLEHFKNWFLQEFELSKVSVPGAGCFSTIGLDGFPNARYVSLKEVRNGKLIITGSLDSRKGVEVANCNKVALTFWWPESERQVRIQGEAEKIPDELADYYFAERNDYSKLIAIVSEQGRDIEQLDVLQQKINNLFETAKEQEWVRPVNWSGFSINPFRIEFMQFKKDRFHHRELFEFKAGVWSMKTLQP